ncbi:MAG: DinB family protein [Acidimicrobiia bacterium]|nr:DinB family protein [Acidimicrobiia bacterium]
MDRRVVDYLARVDAIEPRLLSVARPYSGLTEADANSGDRWDALQAWGHITEFVPYWIEQIEEVVDDYRGEPVPFGRAKADPDRLAGIESGRSMDFDTHRHWLEVHLADLRGFLQALSGDSWAASGLHSRLGSMSLERMIEEFLVGHLEEHADQLETLSTSEG